MGISSRLRPDVSSPRRAAPAEERSCCARPVTELERPRSRVVLPAVRTDVPILAGEELPRAAEKRLPNDCKELRLLRLPVAVLGMFSGLCTGVR